ncbi:cyanophycinase [Flavimobilis marinus]|uniref:hypothetical protein n=1 Tax=Flavimobilis marinus TaxID=285351 RepID=UPI000B8887F8|nr:hypothetical protein [Flavimobilis marinus]GHG51897.1 cyanophycinase [Flavimobilis marinus]
MTVVLVGGGPDTVADRAVVAPFLASLERRDRRARVAYVLFDVDGSAGAFLPQYVALLSEVDHEVVLVTAGPQTLIQPGAFASVDAVVVAGGPTPGYYASLAPAFDALRQLVHDGGAYLGFSAGAMIAPRQALLGGSRWRGVDVCPEEWSEGLDEIQIADGIGLFPHPVEVHVAQAGTLGNLIALAQDGVAPTLLGIDEDTSLLVEEDGTWTRHGSGAIWVVEAQDGSAAVRRHVS